MDILERLTTFQPSYGDRGDAIDMILDAAAEIARLRKAIVMLARGDIYWSSGDREVWLLRGPGDCPALPCDGSPEQIVATVCRLAEGE